MLPNARKTNYFWRSEPCAFYLVKTGKGVNSEFVLDYWLAKSKKTIKFFWLLQMQIRMNAFSNSWNINFIFLISFVILVIEISAVFQICQIVTMFYEKRVSWCNTITALGVEWSSMFYFPYLFIFLPGGQPKDNPPFFCRLILDLAQYFHSASSRKCRQLSPREVTFSLDEREVTWLCFHAFQSCLRKKQSRYEELLKFLRKGLSQLRLPAEDFKTVIDTSQHAVFKLVRWMHMQASWESEIKVSHIEPCEVSMTILKSSAGKGLVSCDKPFLRYFSSSQTVEEFIRSPKCWWQGRRQKSR